MMIDGLILDFRAKLTKLGYTDVQVAAGRRPRNTPHAITVQKITGGKEYVLSGPEVTEEGLFQIDGWTTDLTTRNTLSSLISTMLPDGKCGSVVDEEGTTYVIEGCTMVNDRTTEEKPEDSSDAWTFRYSSDWSITHTKQE